MPVKTCNCYKTCWGEMCVEHLSTDKRYHNSFLSSEDMASQLCQINHPPFHYEIPTPLYLNEILHNIIHPSMIEYYQICYGTKSWYSVVTGSREQVLFPCLSVDDTNILEKTKHNKQTKKTRPFRHILSSLLVCNIRKGGKPHATYYLPVSSEWLSQAPKKVSCSRYDT